MLLVRLAIVTLALSLASACSTSAVTRSKPDSAPGEQERRDLLVGNWVGTAELKDGGIRKWLMQRRPDGTYVVTIDVALIGGARERSQEFGHWGLSGPIYFTHTQGWIEDGKRKFADASRVFFNDA